MTIINIYRKKRRNKGNFQCTRFFSLPRSICVIRMGCVYFNLHRTNNFRRSIRSQWLNDREQRAKQIRIRICAPFFCTILFSILSGSICRSTILASTFYIPLRCFIVTIWASSTSIKFHCVYASIQWLMGFHLSAMFRFASLRSTLIAAGLSEVWRLWTSIRVENQFELKKKKTEIWRK